MGVPVLVMGFSGSGKSASLRNFEPDEIGIFNVASKPLPFRKQLPLVNLVQFVILNTSPDTIVYFLHHPEQTEQGRIKAKTVGKLIDNWLTLEGLFSIVLLAETDGKEHWFITQSDGYSTAKSPMDMFPEKIDNDLKLVDKTIREYYEFGGKTDEKI